MLLAFFPMAFKKKPIWPQEVKARVAMGLLQENIALYITFLTESSA